MPIIYALIFMFGASIFSFLNVVAYRLPKKMNYVSDHSICPSCGHRLGALDMFPVFGYIVLLGKCRYCKTKISPRYFLMEVAGGLLSLFCVLKYDFTLKAAAVFAFVCILTVVAFVDIEIMEIPNGFVLAMLIVGILSYFAFPEISILDRAIGFVSVSVPMFAIAMLTGGFGGGDIKLMAASGVFFGWQLNYVAVFFGIVFGGLYGIFLMLVKKKAGTHEFAFGPFLCLGMALTLIVGNWLVYEYLAPIAVIFE